MEWVGGPVAAVEPVASNGPVLVHFLDFAQLNSLRALPYVRAWSERYGAHGLSTFGVHTPRSSLTADPVSAARGVAALGLDHPVALDLDRVIWRDYGCEGWPSSFVWARGGRLVWYALGEGDYGPTEAVIRETLPEPDGGWPPPIPPLKPGDGQDEAVVVPSAEVFPGGGLETPWEARPGDDRLELAYEGGGAYATVGGTGTLSARIDGGDPREIEVDGPALIELGAHEHHERHTLSIEAEGDLRLLSVSFPPAPA